MGSRPRRLRDSGPREVRAGLVKGTREPVTSGRSGVNVLAAPMACQARARPPAKMTVRGRVLARAPAMGFQFEPNLLLGEPGAGLSQHIRWNWVIFPSDIGKLGHQQHDRSRNPDHSGRKAAALAGRWRRLARSLGFR